MNYKELAFAIVRAMIDRDTAKDVVDELDEWGLLGDMKRVAADMEAIAARQARERTAWSDEWSVADRYAEKSPTFSFSKEEAERIASGDERLVLMHRRVTDWRKVNLAESDEV